MARKFALATENYLSRGETVVNTTPFSIAAWYNSVQDVKSDYLLTLSDASNAKDRVALYHAWTTNLLYLEWTPQGGAHAAISSATVSYGVWEHACGVAAAANDLRVYLNGGNKGTSGAAGGAIQWANMDTTAIGALVWNNTVGGWPTGNVAGVAVYRGILTDNDAMLLGKKRLCPLLVKPQLLIAYWDLRHGDNSDWLGRYGMVPTNAPGDAPPPPIVYPERDDPVWGLVLPRYRPIYYWPVVTSPAVGDLSVSVSDSVSAAESLGRLLALNFPGVSDSVSLAESIISSMLLTGVGVSDSISLAESVGRVLISLIGVSDSVGIAEATAAAMLLTGISVSDSVAVSESIAALMLLAGISVSESVGVAEAIAASMLLTGVSVSDAVSLAESVATSMLLTGVSVSDSINVAESVGRLLTILVSTSEGISLSETVTASMLAALSVSDSVGVAESLDHLVAILASASDSVTVAEAISALMSDLLLSVSDTAALAEAITISLQAAEIYSISVSDTVVLAEAIQTAMGVLAASALDTVGLAEAITTSMLVTGISVSDSISLAELIAGSVLTPGVALAILVSDAVSLSESMTAVLLAIVSIGLTLQARSLGLTLQQRDIGLELQERSISLTLRSRE